LSGASLFQDQVAAALLLPRKIPLPALWCVFSDSKMS